VSRSELWDELRVYLASGVRGNAGCLSRVALSHKRLDNTGRFGYPMAATETLT
jgi:hypothetical protein